MGIGQLVDDLVEDIQPSIDQLDDVLRLAEQTRVLAKLSSLEAVKAGEYGRGISQASEEIGELAKTAYEYSRVIAIVVNDSNACLAKTQAIVASVEARQGGSQSPADLYQQLLEQQASLESTQRLLNRNLEVLPVSFLGQGGEMAAAMDTVQIEYLIRQAMRNARDKLSAVKLVLTSVMEFCRGFDHWDQVTDVELQNVQRSIEQKMQSL